jgi:hypothetical protein
MRGAADCGEGASVANRRPSIRLRRQCSAQQRNEESAWGSKRSHGVDFDLLEAASRSEGVSSRIERDTPDNATVLASLRGQGPSSKRETWQRYGQAGRLSTPRAG